MRSYPKPHVALAPRPSSPDRSRSGKLSRLGRAIRESAASRHARQALTLLPLTALVEAVRERRPLADAEIDALLAVEASPSSARALLLGLHCLGLVTEASLRVATARWSGMLVGEA